MDRHHDGDHDQEEDEDDYVGHDGRANHQLLWLLLLSLSLLALEGSCCVAHCRVGAENLDSMNSVLNPEYLGEFGPSGGGGINEAPALEAVQRCRVMFLHAMSWV